jgi:hypothetical protein
MGVSINWRLSQTQANIKSTLDSAEQAAKFIQEERAKQEGITFSVSRPSFNELAIDCDGCQTMRLEFRSPSYWEKLEGTFGGHSYEYNVLTGEGKAKLREGYKIAEFPQNEIWYAAGFCETQFVKKIIEHKWLADILRVVAGHCQLAIVTDEGEYYHSGELDDIARAIAAHGAVIGGEMKNYSYGLQD